MSNSEEEKVMMQNKIQKDEKKPFKFINCLELLVFRPDGNFYSFWKFLIGLTSLLSSFLYTYLLGEGIPDSVLSWVNLLCGMLELIYLTDIVLSFFKGFNEDYGEFELRFQKTWRHFFYSDEFKIKLFVWLPLGYLGAYSSFFRILFIVKLTRILNFLQIFEHRFYRPVLNGIQDYRLKMLDERQRKKNKDRAFAGQA